MSSSESSTSDLAAAVERANDSPVFRVLICDTGTAQLSVVTQAVSDAGAKPIVVENSNSESVRSFSCPIALVGFSEAPESTVPALEKVRALVDCAITVIGYGDGIQKWPLKNRCNILIAGAHAIFDSSLNSFAQELRCTLSEILRLQTLRLVEEKRIKSKLESLGIIGESRTMQAIFKLIDRAAVLSDLPILITGETGTGKELMVSAIHKLDPKRSTGPLIALNCGAITAGVAESELFGHRRGAFTGADRDRRGLIRAADGGILFLDEIGDLDLSLQSKLLRVLQENRVLGVGEDRESPVNVRVIAATNRNLEEMVSAGEFRDDLFHRLNILTVHIPALRHRRGDIEPLVKHFVEKHKTLSGGQALPVDAEFIEALMWLEMRGNARELENLVRRVLVNRKSDGTLSLADLPPEVLGKLVAESVGARDSKHPTHDTAAEPPAGHHLDDYDVSLFRLLQLHHGDLAETLEHCEHSLIASALSQTKGNQSLAARLLGITPRSVYNKLRKYRLSATGDRQTTRPRNVSTLLPDMQK
jgi:transcriptional regulator with GAF, ATPase, and Fis domain